MTDDNNDNIDDVNAGSDDGSDEGVKTINKSIPYDRFKKANDRFRAEETKSKELEEKLKVYQDAEKKQAEDKLLKEGEYTELLKAKELEVETLKTEKENLRKESKLEKVRSKVINSANKEGAVDGEDILRFINASDLIDVESEKLDELINSRISKIKTDKGHLFSTSRRNTQENGQPYSANTKKVATGSRLEQGRDLLKNLNLK